MFGLVIAFPLAPGKREEFLQTVDSLLPPTGLEAGLETQAVFEQVGEADRFLWWERWSSPRKIEERLTSTELNTLLGAIRVLGELDDLQIVESREETESAVN